MAYERLNLKTDDLLDEAVFKKIDDAIEALSGKYIDAKDSINIANSKTSNCTISISDDGYVYTRKSSATANTTGFVVALGQYQNIKNKTFYLNFKDLSDNSDIVIPKVYSYLSLNYAYNFGTAVVDFKTDTSKTEINKKKLSFEINMNSYSIDCGDTDTIYLIIGFYKNTLDMGQSILCDIHTFTPQFVELNDIFAAGGIQDVKRYYLNTPVAVTKSTVTESDNNGFTITYKATSGTYYGCSLPLGLYGENKDKTLYFTIKDISGLETIAGLRLYLTNHDKFNISNPLYTIVEASQVSPYSVTVTIADLGLSCTDDEALHLLVYLNYSSIGTPNTVQFQAYYIQKEFALSGGSIDSSNFYNKDQVDEKISNAAGGTYSNYELFTLGDSLSAGSCYWQDECSKRLGCKFRPEFNLDPSYPTSVGGTTSVMDSDVSTFFRAMNLIKYGGIQNQGDRAIITIQNNNDGTFVFNPNARVYRLDKEIEIYELTEEALGAIPEEDRGIGTALKLMQYAAGRVLSVDSVPTIEGDVTLEIGWSGPGYSYYNIHVVPQATEAETIQYIYDKVLEYDFKGTYDEAYDDGTISGVSFCSGNSSYLPRVNFTDTGNTGMTVTVTDVDSVLFAKYRWFNSDDLTQWTNPSLWIIPDSSSGWKSAIEALLTAFPKAKIALFHFPQIKQTQADYLKDNGFYDEVAFYNAVNPNNQTMIKRYKAIADLYRLKFIDIYSICGITATNLTTFYPEKANVHPAQNGYRRIGELMAGEIQGWIKQ